MTPEELVWSIRWEKLNGKHTLKGNLERKQKVIIFQKLQESVLYNS